MGDTADDINPALIMVYSLEMALHYGDYGIFIITLGIKNAQKPYIVWSLGPTALIYESLDSYPKGLKDPIVRYLPGPSFCPQIGVYGP